MIMTGASEAQFSENSETVILIQGLEVDLAGL